MGERVRSEAGKARRVEKRHASGMDLMELVVDGDRASSRKASGVEVVDFGAGTFAWRARSTTANWEGGLHVRVNFGISDWLRASTLRSRYLVYNYDLITSSCPAYLFN